MASTLRIALGGLGIDPRELHAPLVGDLGVELIVYIEHWPNDTRGEMTGLSKCCWS